MIALQLIPCRPLLWASGTYFRPGWHSLNQITLRLQIGEKQDAIAYVNLLNWMHSNAPDNVPCIIDHDRAVKMWESVFG